MFYDFAFCNFFTGVVQVDTCTTVCQVERFEPAEAKRIWDRFEFVYTPKHGSWLNMAEIELNVLNNQCLGRRIGEIETVLHEVEAWETSRNKIDKKINWQFTNADARVKLKRLYPSYHC